MNKNIPMDKFGQALELYGVPACKIISANWYECLVDLGHGMTLTIFLDDFDSLSYKTVMIAKDAVKKDRRI